jgi:hypothetical protein
MAIPSGDITAISLFEIGSTKEMRQNAIAG